MPYFLPLTQVMIPEVGRKRQERTKRMEGRSIVHSFYPFLEGWVSVATLLRPRLLNQL